MKTSLFVVALVAFSLTATAQEMTARAYANARGLENRKSPITLTAPHACTLSQQHPCIYYGGDIDPNDPQENGSSNENTLFLPQFWTYTEVSVPAQLKISAAFTNNLQIYGIIDPQTANWDFRMGVHEGYGGVSIGSGTSPALLTDTGRNAFGLEEYELLTPVSLGTCKSASCAPGNVWFDVQPNCINENDPNCSYDAASPQQYFESDTDGLNGINSKFTVTSNTGMGPTYFSPLFEGIWQSLCNDQGVACGDGMSAGLLK